MKAVFAVYMLMLPVISFAQKSQIDWDKEKLRDKVKTIHYSYKQSLKPIELKNLVFNEHLYNVDSFSENGYMVKQYEVKDGKVNRVTDIHFKFDKSGNPITRCEYQETFEISCKEFIYDDQGQCIEERSLNGDTIRLTKYSYQSGRLIIDEKSQGDSKLKTTYYYYDDGRLAKKVLYYANKGEAVIRYTYNANMIVERWERGYIKMFIYDNQDNEILHKWCGVDGSHCVHYNTEYSYDDKRNWIRKVNDALDYLVIEGNSQQGYYGTVRKIEYY